jgi:hypothetical protein
VGSAWLLRVLLQLSAWDGLVLTVPAPWVESDRGVVLLPG